jgi:hypothetical protein
MATPTKKDTLSQIKNELESRGRQINKGCERDFIRISISSIIGTSPVIDSYSTWLLAGCGAIAALMISNVNSIVPFLGDNGFKVSIYILVCSVIAGLFQKYRSLCIQSFITITEKLISDSNSLNSIQQQAFQELHNEAKKYNIQLDVEPTINLEVIRQEYTNFTPFFLRKKSLLNFNKGAKDDLHGWRKMMKGFKHQVGYFILQFLFFLAFLAFAASFV